jgi:hypothetical protein
VGRRRRSTTRVAKVADKNWMVHKRNGNRRIFIIILLDVIAKTAVKYLFKK